MEGRSTLIVNSENMKTTYRPGESIDYSGLVVSLDGQDVTSQCRFLPEPGTAWNRDDKTIDVHVAYTTPNRMELSAKVPLRRKGNALPVVLVILLIAAVAGIGGFLAWQHLNPTDSEPPAPETPAGDTGSKIIPQGDMTDEEAQELIDDMAEKSRIVVSVAPTMGLSDDGQLRVNFVVPEPNNGLSERLEVEQNGEIVYRSGIVKPGYSIKWGESTGAHVGDATATVYAVVDGTDSGNPVSVDVEIVDAEEYVAAHAEESPSVG